MNAATAPSTPTAAGLKTKFTPVTRNFLRSQIDPKLGWFLMMLEDLAMDRTTGSTTPGESSTTLTSGPPSVPTTPSAACGHRPRTRINRGVPTSSASAPPRVHALGSSGSDGPPIGPSLLPPPLPRLRPSSRPPSPVAGGEPAPSRYPRTTRAPTADLRVHLPQICGCTYRRFAGDPERAPLEERARGLDPDNTEKTTTTRAKSSSFFSASTQIQDPERPDRAEPPGPVASRPIPATDASTHVEAEDPAPGPRARRPKRPCDQALTDRDRWPNSPPGFGKSLDQARPILIGPEAVPDQAKAREFRSTLALWLGEALENPEARGRSPRSRGALEGQQGVPERPRAATPWRRNEARQVRDAVRGWGPDIEARRSFCQDTSQTSWSYAVKGDWSQVDASLQRKLEELKPEIREIIRQETEARDAGG